MLRELVVKTIGRYHIIEPDEGVLIGVSGGPDSVALLHILVEMAPEWRLNLGIAHLNHQIRQEAAQEAEFVKSLAEAYGLPFYLQQIDVPAFCRNMRYSLEEGGRILRYAFWEQTAEKQGYAKIALGHQLDDNAEQVLMNLFRGAGPDGMAGIPPKRGKIIRPLINAPRAAILDYLHTNRYPYMLDCSNEDPRFLRNRVRTKVIPVIKVCFHAKVNETLNRHAELMRSEAAWIEGMVQAAYQEALLNRPQEPMALSVTRLMAHPPALQRRLIRAGIQRVNNGLGAIEARHVEMVLAQLGKPENTAFDLPAGIRLRRQDDALIFAKVSPAIRSRSPSWRAAEEFRYGYQAVGPGVIAIKEIDATLTLAESDSTPNFEVMAANPQTAFLDREAVNYPLTIRNYQPGDCFSPLGLNGTQKLKQFFSDRKIPSNWRKRCPLILDRGQIIWVAGMRIADSVRVTPDTRRILRIELFLA